MQSESPLSWCNQRDTHSHPEELLANTQSLLLVGTLIGSSHVMETSLRQEAKRHGSLFLGLS
jgi:hypothetical protein